jgi:restriction system protein
MLGSKSKFAAEAYKGGFIGADYGMNIDFTTNLPDDWRDFNKQYIPVYLEKNPGKTKIAAGLSCGMLWTIAKGINIGDIVICPDGQGSYYVGEVISDYSYCPESILPHRRYIRWFQNKKITRTEMSQNLLNSTGSIGTVSNITKYADEIETLITGQRHPVLSSNDDTIEDPAVFAIEKHLEDFLAQNWKHTEIGKHYDIFSEDGELVGQQYQSDTGPIDILAISKDKKTLLVVDLKKGRASDVVVGQIQRYMGYVKEELAEKDQIVKGIIIALDDDIRLQRALSVASNIEFYTYKIRFTLEKKK